MSTQGEMGFLPADERGEVVIDEDQMRRLRVQNVLDATESVAASEELRATIARIRQLSQERSPSALYALACSRIFLEGIDHEASRVLWIAVMVAAW